MLRTLCVIITDQVRDAPALAAASAIARREDAHLDVTCLSVMPFDSMTFEAAPVALDLDERGALQEAHRLASWARSTLPPDLRATIETTAASSLGLVGAVAQLARFSDLVVTARPYGPGHARLAPVVAEALLFGSGAPVLVVPGHDRSDWTRPFRRIGLAWNESDEAVRAARAALPFLRAALEVEVVLLGPWAQDRDEEGPAGALLRWLERHDVNARATVLDRGDRRKADLLAGFAVERGCEALVMGAYGHSRLREALLGGTTRDMLAKVPLPLLMAH